MSKPEWCPADVWSVASESLLASLRDDRCGISVRFGMTGDTPAAFREPIARAILAERERAANLCLQRAGHFRSAALHVIVKGTNRALFLEERALEATDCAQAILIPPSIDPAADGGGTAPIGAAATSGDGQ